MPITKRRNATPTSPKRSNRKKSTTIMNKKNNGKEFHGLVLTSAQLLEYPDLVAVDGETVGKNTERPVYIAFNKPVGIVCTTEGRCRQIDF